MPGVDEVLVAPTVVGEQLYRLVAEERGIGEALFVLGRGLEADRVSGEVFVKVSAFVFLVDVDVCLMACANTCWCSKLGV